MALKGPPPAREQRTGSIDKVPRTEQGGNEWVEGQLKRRKARNNPARLRRGSSRRRWDRSRVSPRNPSNQSCVCKIRTTRS